MNENSKEISTITNSDEIIIAAESNTFDRSGKKEGVVQGLYAAARHAYLGKYEYLSKRLHVLGWISLVGFPLFYFVWAFIYPQPYENITIRLIGLFLSMIIVFERFVPKKARRLMPIYTYLFTIYCASFFFTYMLLMNNGNSIWQMSFMCSIIYLVLLLDSINIVVVFVVGTSLAFALAAFSIPFESLVQAYLPTLPIALFALVGGISLNHTDEFIRNQKRMVAVAAVGSSIAHEMRTPLLGIRLNAEGISAILPKFIEGYKWARENGWGQTIQLGADAYQVLQASQRIEQQVRQANHVIDMLLMNISDAHIEKTKFTMCSAREVVQNALSAFPFQNNERVLVSLEEGEDFTFLGSEALMIHVFFNLIKNALRAVANAGKGEIMIRLRTGPAYNFIFFEDTGSGIAPEHLPHVFESFYSGVSDRNGSGIGLHFCRRVIESLDGIISCESSNGAFTKFTIALPKTADA